jgi:NADH-quinone oxidoreductase subunit L
MKADMGGLRKYMPKTFWTFIIGTAALAGIPPLAGFWSKDEILVGAGVFPGTGGNGTYTIPFIFGMITAALTAAYMTRAVYLTFFGEYRGHAHPHESGPRITTPLIILAFMAVVVGFLNVPKGVIKFFGLPEGLSYRFEHWVEPADVPTFVSKAQNGFTHASPSLPLAILATGLGLAAGFIVWRYYSALYAKDPKATEYTDGVASRVPLLASGHKVLENKYYLDHLYSGVIAGGTKGPLARAAYWFNQTVLDGIVNTVGKTSVVLGRFTYNVLDQGIIDRLVNLSGLSASSTGQFLRRIQTGQVREYAALMFGAAAVVGAVFIFAV